MTHSIGPEEVIAGLYEAAAIPEHWADALANLTSFTRSKASHFFDWKPEGGGTWGAAGWRPGAGIDPGADESYRRHFGAIDPRRPLFQATLDRVWNCAEAMSDEQMLGAREIYHDFLIPNGLRWTITASARASDGRVLTLASLRGQHDGAYGEEEETRLGLLARHVSHLDRLRARFVELGGPPRLALAALDEVASGIVLCDAASRLIYVNPAAEAIARDGGISLAGREVRAVRRADEARLAAGIRAAARPAPHVEGGVGDAVRIEREADLGDLYILVAPLSARTTPTGIAERPATLLIIEVGRRRASAVARHLADWFGLSPGEIRLALDLMDGSRPETVAARHGKRISTIRSQLSQLLAKTGTHRQADLIALLTRLPRRSGGPTR